MKKFNKLKKSTKILIVIIIAAIVGVCAIGGTAYANKVNEHNDAVHNIYNAYEAERAEGVIYLGEDVGRECVLTRLVNLNDLKAEVEANKDSFKLYNGNLYNYEELIAAIMSESRTMKNYILSGYNNEYSLNNVDVDGEDVTKSSLIENVNALESLLATIDSEKDYGIWDNNEDYDAFILKVNDSMNAYNGKIAEIEAAEKAAASAASKKPVVNSSSNNTVSSGGFNIPYNFKSAGVLYDSEWRYTYYSSRVLYHYKTPQWTLGSDGIYRDSNGYVIVACDRYSIGTVIQTELFGACIVQDCGVGRNDTLDIYVGW